MSKKTTLGKEQEQRNYYLIHIKYDIYGQKLSVESLVAAANSEEAIEKLTATLPVDHRCLSITNKTLE